jgi:type IV secretory pathway VirB2 component (pilin)
MNKISLNKIIINITIFLTIIFLLINSSFGASIDDVLSEGETILEKILKWVNGFIRIACTLGFVWNLYQYAKNNASWESTLKWIMVILAIAASNEIINYLFGLFSQ